MSTQLEEMVHELAMHFEMWSGCVLNDTINRTLFAFIDVDSMSIHFFSPHFLSLPCKRGHARSIVDSNNQISSCMGAGGN